MKNFYAAASLFLLAAACNQNQNSSNLNQYQSPQVKLVPEEQSHNSAHNGWLVYQNTKYDYELSYPPGVIIASANRKLAPTASDVISFSTLGHNAMIWICATTNTNKISPEDVAHLFADASLGTDVAPCVNSSKEIQATTSSALAGLPALKESLVIKGHSYVCYYVATKQLTLGVCNINDAEGGSNLNQEYFEDLIISTLKITQ